MARCRWTVGVCVAVMIGLAACGPAQRESASRLSTTTLASATTTTDATMPEACPPGCALPSDYDAITVLASSATLVAIVDVQNVRGSGSRATAAVKVDRTLQGNPHDLVYAPTRSSLGLSLAQTGNVVDGGSYLVFMSYNRGGPCLSSLFSVDLATQVATLFESNDGPTDGIVIPGRLLEIPSSITVSDVRARMYPTGGVVYPTDTAEWFCPGP
jgi:hypothetical protein